jgi:hypothetical protein
MSRNRWRWPRKLRFMDRAQLQDQIVNARTLEECDAALAAGARWLEDQPDDDDIRALLSVPWKIKRGYEVGLLGPLTQNVG